MNYTGTMFIKTVLALYLAAIAFAAPTPKGSFNFDDRAEHSPLGRSEGELDFSR